MKKKAIFKETFCWRTIFLLTCFLLDNFTKRQKHLEKSIPDTNAHLKNFTQKGKGFIDNKYLKEAHFGKKKKVYINKTGNRAFAKMV